MTQKVSFDIYKERKFIFQGKEYPVRAKTVKEEAGVIRGFRAAYEKIAEEAAAVKPGDKKAARDCKAKEIQTMSEVIMTFCDIDAQTLMAVPVKPFYELHGYAFGGGVLSEPLNADEHLVAGLIEDGGREYEVEAPSVMDVIKIFEIADERMIPSSVSGDSEEEMAALIDLIEPYVPFSADELREKSVDALRRVFNMILLNARGIAEDDEKN